jgi:hypothetical protein
MRDFILKEAPGTQSGSFAKPRSYEETRERLETIIKEYRVGARSETDRATAIEAIRQLGFSQGDAARWLDGRQRRLGYV